VLVEVEELEVVDDEDDEVEVVDELVVVDDDVEDVVVGS